ncbi:Ricin B-like lectins domain-containing protein [Dioscorea alata]|uniref:Ricin B-like lectins domain-containing protein n=1 Tax=Dioscorea alata TaxID=55571 RepID=A0ACB7UU20_DIOAL|nr:Ricin B-like lectins domain-containing protein [Dioscorea alata]
MDMKMVTIIPPLIMACANLLLQQPSFVTSLPFPPTTPLDKPGHVLTVRRSSFEIFHPTSGTCVIRKSLTDPLRLGPCSQSDPWAYTPQKFLTVKGTYFCLQASASGKPAKLGIVCTAPDSSWEVTSNSKSQIASKSADSSSLCLDVDPSNVLVTNPCLCINGDGACEADNQWFEINPWSAKQNGDSGTLLASRLSSSPP